MPHNKPIRIKHHTQKKSLSDSSDSAGRNILRLLDGNIIIFIILVVLFLSFGVSINLNFKRNFINSPLEFQLKDLTPDAHLYYGLAQNLANGTGFYDTIRNDEIVPSIGHPAFLAVFCVIGGLTPAKFSWLFFMLSFVLLAAAVRIYCKSNLLVILSLCLLGGFFKYIWWYAANVETTIIFANILLAVALAVFYRNSFSILWAVICGIALYIHLTVRPLFLFPMHLFFAVFLVLFLYFHIKKRQTAAFSFVRGWLILLITAECLIWLTYGYSYTRYHDGRLVTGTYSEYPLYAGNTIYIPPDSIFDYRVQYPEEFNKMFSLLKDNPGMTWQQRHKIMMNEVVDYWKQYPSKAIAGWWWRFRQFMGIWSGNFSWKMPLSVLHAFSTSALFVLIVLRVVSAFRLKIMADVISDLKDSLGLIFALLFLIYSAFHALFSYVGFRYASVIIPLFIVADVFLISEVIGNLWTVGLPLRITSKQIKK